MRDHFHRDPTYLFYFLLGCCLSNPTRKVCICRILPALKKAAYHHPVLKPRYPEWSDYCECHVFWSPDGGFHHQSIQDVAHFQYNIERTTHPTLAFRLSRRTRKQPQPSDYSEFCIFLNLFLCGNFPERKLNFSLNVIRFCCCSVTKWSKSCLEAVKKA